MLQKATVLYFHLYQCLRVQTSVLFAKHCLLASSSCAGRNLGIICLPSSAQPLLEGCQEWLAELAGRCLACTVQGLCRAASESWHDRHSSTVDSPVKKNIHDFFPARQFKYVSICRRSPRFSPFQPWPPPNLLVPGRKQLFCLRPCVLPLLIAVMEAPSLLAFKYSAKLS